MNKDWFPFFSMLFWWSTKVAGLALCGSGMWILIAQFTMEFRFVSFLVAGLVPIAAGGLLLCTEVVYDLATAEMRRRQAVAK